MGWFPWGWVIAVCLAGPCLAGPWVAVARGFDPAQKQPFFVGHSECAKCHQGAGFGYQQCLSLLTAHSTAWASLASPEAKEIARLSGIPEHPQQSAMCLGCHATGAEAETWERDPTFHIVDGVQCEKCHGAGSEYMAESVMVDRRAARAAGLKMPTKDDCMHCHKVKGSHVAVLGSPKFDIDEAWEQIRHPTPDVWRYMEPHTFPEPNDPHGHQYAGSHKCGECHKGPEMGYQYSKWRLSGHALAYARLGTERAREIAREAGLEEDPLVSASCLKCHATAYHDPAGGRLESYTIYEGVGCESCHGAGSDFAVEAIMRDRPSALLAGLKTPTRDTCLACHENAHGKPFDYEAALQAIAHPLQPPPPTAAIRYKTPLRMALDPDGRFLYATCEASHSVAVVDAKRGQMVAEIPVGRHPIGVTFHPSGQWLYVTNWLDDSVSVVRVADRQVVATIGVGDEPHGLHTDPTGQHLFVLNTSTDDISVIDTQTLSEVKRLEAGRNPWALALSPDGTQLAVTNTLPHFVPFRQSPYAEVTIIDARSAMVEQRVQVPEANLLMGVCWHPSGEFALTTMNRTKNLVPMTRLLQGWTITNGLAIIWRDGRVDQVLLDEPNLGFADPMEVAITPDGRLALVTSSGTDRVAVVDLERLLTMLDQADEYERTRIIPNHRGKPTEFIIKHIPTSHSPRGLVITPDGKTAFVATSLDDSITMIDLESLEPVKRIDLGGPEEITKIRYGERLFHSADITFHRQFSCKTCHPGGHVDGLTYDIEADGIGMNPVDNRTLRGILDTAPFKWAGTNPSFSRQCGIRLSTFFTRLHPFNPEDLSALDTYVCTIPRPPNRYRPQGAELTDAQRRGKLVFERTRTNDGREIPRMNRCITCHPPPLYTDRNIHNVGTMMEGDTFGAFDTPHLNNIYDSAPYLHNGIAETLEEIWTRFNPYDEHGVTNDMTKDELNDLIEYLKTL
jgi:YVTN family beta-propeller protein